MELRTIMRRYPLLIIASILSTLVFQTSLRAVPSTDTTLAQARPLQTDAASERLIQNHLVASGGILAHSRINNIAVEGTQQIRSETKAFTLIETNDGKRHLTYRWKHLGRQYEEIYVFDGLRAWKQVRLPSPQPAKSLVGLEGAHFGSVHWFLQPFTLPMRGSYEFSFDRASRVGTRESYRVNGSGKQGIQQSFHFDKETALLIRWGGDGLVAGSQQRLNYQATHFTAVEGVQFPKAISLLIGTKPYGYIRIERLTTNVDISMIDFFRSGRKTPTLRQLTR